MKNDAMVVLRMPLALRKALKQAAEADVRSMSSMVVKILMQHLAETGFYGVKPTPKPRRTKR